MNLIISILGWIFLVLFSCGIIVCFILYLDASGDSKVNGKKQDRYKSFWS